MRDLVFILLFFGLTASAQIVNIPDANFKYHLVNLNCVDTDGDGVGDDDVDTNDDGEIQYIEAQDVIWLDVNSQSLPSYKIEDLDGIQYFTDLEYLKCSHNELNEIDVSQNGQLINLNISVNNLTNLDVSQNSFLEYLDLSFNNCTSLDVNNNQNLLSLNFFNNQLDTFISNNQNLEFIDCSANNFTFLDFSNNPNLELLVSEFNNNLTSIVLGQNSNLTGIRAYDSSLTSLNTTGCPNLESLDLTRNEISSIDLSNNTNLKLLGLSNNQFVSLDLSNNPNLEIFTCTNNQLEYLNIANGNNTNFITIYMSGNSNLFCIQVDSVAYANNQICNTDPPYGGWCKDPWSEYSEYCELGYDEFLSEGITVYPNPVKDILSINNKSTTQITSIKLFDVLGTLVLTEKRDVEQIDVSNLDSGVMLVEIETNQGIVTKKIIKE